ncbi:hypothetical protein BKA67DRAFT_659191 [Truncatella angustata]|uniref:Uncharacterized protein n=1 Tax=Truncatella angustata TaxID=152316 RepID=A0A9P8UI68_9PEZI|nr:uncharacterized protein BKA67DRAFT_659191 [Truncatella angustata]KAH6652483.1 hypothetical protein BKA67DRAFT_659191 [Truncatella angustata]
MTPPCKIFKADELEDAVQLNLAQRKRKTAGGKDIDLAQCPLFSMVQYDCQIERPDLPHSPVQCFEVQRWFRRCQDKKGSFMVETTNWEGKAERDVSIASSSAAAAAADSRKVGDQNNGWMHLWKERELSHDGQYRER